MLTKLKAAHAELAEGIEALEAEARRAQPAEATLSAARLKLTRASSRRKALIEHTIIPSLGGLSPDDTRRVEDLRRTGADMALESTRHIGSWTMRAILADWSGYRRASKAMRSAMLRRIDQEKAVFYPLLGGRVGDPAARPHFPTSQSSIPI